MAHLRQVHSGYKLAFDDDSMIGMIPYSIGTAVLHKRSNILGAALVVATGIQ